MHLLVCLRKSCGGLRALACAAVLLLVTAGCGGKPPESFTAAELPGAMAEAFAKASPDLKKLADQAVASFERNDHTKAMLDFQSLCARTDLSERQRAIASRCLLTVSESLQAAEAQGDSKASQMRQIHRAEK